MGGLDGWAVSQGCLAIRSRAVVSDPDPYVDEMVSAIAKSAGETQALKTLDGLASRLNVPHLRQVVLMKKAKMLYALSRFSDCLAALDEADGVSGGSVRPQKDLSTVILRATAQLQLAKYDEALASLAKTGDAAGTPDEKAQVLFLTGWAQLKNNSKTQAMDTFRRLTQDHPGTTSAGKAMTLLRRLEGE